MNFGLKNWFNLLAFLVFLSCSGEPTAPDNNPPTGTQLHVERFELPAGETQTFPAGFEIIAEKGVNIAGVILVQPSRPGDFTVTAESGDIEISGVIKVQPSSSANAAGQSPNLSKSGAEGADGTSIKIQALAGNLAISSTGTWKAGNGGNGDSIIIARAVSEPLVEGNNGGDGGYVILRAPQGAVS